MWQRLATSELLSTFFPTWLNGGNKNGTDSYWLNTNAHPVLSSFYPWNSFSKSIAKNKGPDIQFLIFLWSIVSHILFGSIGWFFLFKESYSTIISIFGAITIAYGAYSLKQQPCIIYTLAWFPLTLYQNPFISSVAVGMMLLAGYYPFSIYLLPVAIVAHLFWYKEAFLLFGILIALIQLVPFIKYLPKTVKRMRDKCESPEVERRFYVGVIPIMLIPFSTSRIWPLTLLSCVLSLGLLKSFFPRVHERWLIVVQFCVGWQAVSGLNNLNLAFTPLVILVLVHVFDLYWHNRSCIPPRPWCELYHKPSWAFKNKLTKYLETNLGDYRVAGLPHPLFTGLVNGFKTMGYQGSMQLKLMAKWRGTSGSHGLEGVKEEDATRYRVKFCYSRTRPYKWEPTEIRFLWRNPSF